MSGTEKLSDRNARRNHLQKNTKPCKTIQVMSKAQMNEQYMEQCLKRTLIQSDSTEILQHPKRHVKAPAKLNL